MRSDETLYRQYLNGDEKAAEPLVEKYGDALTLYINGYVKDIHESEDLMIEAFSRLFAKARSIDGEGSFKAYLYKTARNLALWHMQKHRIFFLHFHELEFEPQSEVLTDTKIYRAERYRALSEAFEKLKAEYREASYMFFLSLQIVRTEQTGISFSVPALLYVVFLAACIMIFEIFGPSRLMSLLLAVTVGVNAYLSCNRIQHQMANGWLDRVMLLCLTLQVLLYIVSIFMSDYTHFNVYFVIDIALSCCFAVLLPLTLREVHQR